MFLKFRQKVLSWLRESDDYDNRGNFLYPSDIRYSEPNKYSDITSTRAANAVRRPIRTNSKAIPIRIEDEDEVESNLRTRGFILKVVPGAGGLAVETRKFDDQIGEWATVVHIIPESENLAESIAHIITLQSLRG